MQGWPFPYSGRPSPRSEPKRYEDPGKAGAVSEVGDVSDIDVRRRLNQSVRTRRTSSGFERSTGDTRAREHEGPVTKDPQRVEEVTWAAAEGRRERVNGQ